MTSIFNYNTLEVTLDTRTRAVFLNLARPQQENAINFEMLFELESFFNWISAHIEVNSLLISGVGHKFSVGIDQEELVEMNDEKIQRFLSKMQKLIYSLFYLPQTIIIDLKNGAQNIAAEFASAADLRIIHQNGNIQFDHLEKAIVPCCGGISFLSSLIGTNFVKNWILSGEKISSQTLTHAGFTHSSYQDETHLETQRRYSDIIAKQAPIARIQTKRSLLETHLNNLEKGLRFEKDFAIAGMCTRDWENAIKNQDATFTSAKALAQKLKQDRNPAPVS